MRRPVLERLHAKVIQQSDGCWIFTGCTSTNGYGHIRGDNQKMRRPHIITWEAKNGPIPFGLEIDHLCKNRLCCNPDHMELVTHIENVRRSNLAAVARAQLMSLSPEERSMRAIKAANKRWGNV